MQQLEGELAAAKGAWEQEKASGTQAQAELKRY